MLLQSFMFNTYAIFFVMKGTQDVMAQKKEFPSYPKFELNSILIKCSNIQANVFFVVTLCGSFVIFS